VSGVRLSTVGKLTRKPWYGMWRFIEARFYHGREYTLQVPYGRRVLTPWFNQNGQSEFGAILQAVRSGGAFTQTPDRAYLLYQFVKQCASLPGEMAECGVYKGGSAQLIAAALSQKQASTTLHLFDTFAGVPDFAVPERDYHQAGQYADTSLEAVKQRLREYAEICVFHPGVIPDTLAEVADVQQYSLVNVDVDLQPTNLACCEWFWPRLVPGGVMIFNDYGFYPYRVSTRGTVDAFFAAHQEQPIILPTGQAVVIKMAAGK
jgi:O-methyltransferase